MKNILIGLMLAGLTSSMAFADGNTQDPSNNQNQSGTTMQAQPQANAGMSGASNDMLNQQQQQAPQQDNNGTQD